MDKGDIYFAISITLEVFAFFGIEWRHIRAWATDTGDGKKQMSRVRFPGRQVLYVSLIFAGLIASSIGWYKVSHLQPDSIALNLSVYDPPYPAPMQVISDRTFEDQDVPLDGYIYERSTFKNVCFLYDGGAFGLHNSIVKDHWKVCVKDQRIKNHSTLLDALQLTFKPSVKKEVVLPR